MIKVKKAQKGGCLSTTGSGTRTSIYKSAAGEGGSGSNSKSARQFARAERKMDKAQAKLDREEAAAKAKAPKAKSGMKVKKAQVGRFVTTKMTKAAQDKLTDKMAKSLDRASVLGKNYIAPGDSAKKKAVKKPVPKKKMGGPVKACWGTSKMKKK
jgi:hypothetical protein